MDKKEKFLNQIKEGYTFKGDYFVLGTAIYDGQPIENSPIKIPLKTLNRHGLIAGATGTGKTKTLQVIAENLSANSVPVLLMDIKGDLSGIATPGESKPFIEERHKAIGIPYTPTQFPAEFLTISKEQGTRMRATVSEFGPVLLSKILELNDTQSGLVSIIFKYSDDHRLPLVDLKDFKKVLQYLSEEGKQTIEKDYGAISTTSMGTILRKVVELEQQGAAQFFGERSFDVQDLMRISDDGKGYISIFRITDLQDRPRLFATFMLSLLAEIYATFPEEGDLDRPKLVIFIDEAHLIFENASKALLDQIESIVRLIRSKGVGIFFCTQNPMDVPREILGQLGLKVQHALRAFTAIDRKNIKLTAENYPISEFYKTEELLTSLGIGEAAVTVLSEKGAPTPLAAVLLRAPMSRMGILTNDELTGIISKSKLGKKYNEEIDSESAYEILTKKLKSIEENEEEEDQQASPKKGTGKKEKSTFEEIIDHSVTKQIGRTIFRELTRGLLGALGVNKSTGRRRR
jgi:uncharacterized protein